MPVAKRRQHPPSAQGGTRKPWTRTACLTARRWTEDRAKEEAHRNRFAAPEKCPIAFRCPHGDHYHVSAPPLACRACEGAGQNSRGTSECRPCKGTGVATEAAK